MGREVRVAPTRRAGEATALAAQAVLDHYQLVVAAGGDGTVNEAANGLAGSDVPLTCLPGGSANVFCKLLGIPGEIVDATGLIFKMLVPGRFLYAYGTFYPEGNAVSYQLVGEDEADIRGGRISITSPIARALIGKGQGDIVEVTAPGKTRSYEIVSVKYI